MSPRFLLLCLVCCGIATTPTSAQTELTPFRPGSTLEGVNYFLPKTMFEVVIVAEKSITTPGEFAAYADRYLRLSNVPSQTSTSWSLKRIDLLPYGMPDSTKAYSIKVKSKTVAPLVSLTDDGILLGINTEVKPDSVPSLPKAVPAPKPVNGRDYMTKAILSAGSVAKMAQLTADEIYDIRDSRNALLRGEADNTPKDGQQLKLMLDGLDKQSFALESLFKGQTLSSTEVFSFDYDPKPAAQTDSSTSIPSRESRSILFRFSKKMGLVDADDLSGDPYFITITPLGTLPSEADDPAVQRKQAKMEKGVWVNQPQRCRITISSPSQILLTTELSLAQWGTTTLLSDVLFNKQPETRLILHQTTGSVKHLTGPRH